MLFGFLFICVCVFLIFLKSHIFLTTGYQVSCGEIQWGTNPYSYRASYLLEQSQYSKIMWVRVLNLFVFSPTRYLEDGKP